MDIIERLNADLMTDSEPIDNTSTIDIGAVIARLTTLETAVNDLTRSIRDLSANAERENEKSDQSENQGREIINDGSQADIHIS